MNGDFLHLKFSICITPKLHGGWNVGKLISFIVCSICLIFSNVALSAPKNSRSLNKKSSGICESFLAANSGLVENSGSQIDEVNLSADNSRSSASVEPLKISDVRIGLGDLYDLSSQNPIVQFPTLVMTAAQKYLQLVNIAKPYKTKDPVFGVADVEIYPAFTGQLDIPGTGMIVGQYHAIEALVSHIASAARGEKGGKIFGAIGPSGTGKTEMFNVLDGIRRQLSKSNPQFYEFSFKWKGLHDIPALRGLTPKMGGEVAFAEINPDIKRSPFTLLREDMQQDIIEAVRPEVEKNLGFKLEVWFEASPKDAAIIEQIMMYEDKQISSGEKSISDLSPEEYLNILEKYVHIVPKLRGKNGASEIIRALGPNPNFEKLFVEQNPLRMMLYPGDSPLSWDYTGKVVQQDGGALIFDEAPRNEKEVLDSLLEVAQNSIAEAAGPPVHLDIVSMYTGNDESIISARENGDLNAFMDRSHTVPMRLNIHPWEIAKTALLMVGPNKFLMRKLGTGKPEKLEPLDLNKAFPLPEANGFLKGIYRRYALYYSYRSDEAPILISPHSIEMLSLTAAITRLNVDPKEFAKFPGEFEKITPQQQYFVNPVARLKMILGQDNVSLAVRTEIAKLSNLTREGESGISARDMQSWIKEALDMAIKQGYGVLTPEILDVAFSKLLNAGTIKVPSNALRTAWLQRYALVKNHFTLPGLYRDLQEMIAGHGQRAERIYDAITGEIIALSADANANSWQPDNSAPAQPINSKRLEAIKVKYKELHSREFTYNFLLRHMATSNRESRNPELLAAVEAYLTDTELEIADTAKELIAYHSGSNTNPEIQKAAILIEGRLANYGYDKASFAAALSYWTTLHSVPKKTPETR